MLDEKQIEGVARKAAQIAYTVLGLDCEYTVVLIDDESVSEDARLDTQANEIQINLAQLEPFPADSFTGTSDWETEEDRLLDENCRHQLKICYLVFHEMRHVYQKRAIQVYSLNQMLGSKSYPQPESDKKSQQWLDEMTGKASTTDIEEDANDFAYYLTNRYPIKLPMQRTSRRLGTFKRKYDKVVIPE